LTEESSREAASLKTPKVVTTGPDGPFNLDMGSGPIRRIGIEGIDEVTFFKRRTENEVTTVEINFVGDGSFFIQ
jgi:hypothetical protein